MNESFFTSKLISEALRISSLKSDLTFTNIITDSRVIEKGCLFAAIKGDKFDAHDFIFESIEKGAVGLIYEDHYNDEVLLKKFANEIKENKLVFYKVKNTETALRKISQSIRNEVKIPIICVAGSVGKTTTKELLKALFEQSSFGKENILSTTGSQNGYLGIALTLLRMKKSTQIALIEVGIDECGAMKEHMDLLSPTHTLLTAIGPEHLEKLINIETVLKEEWISITETLKNNGKVFIQECDPLILEESLKLKLSALHWLPEHIIRVTEKSCLDENKNISNKTGIVNKISEESNGSKHYLFEITSPLELKLLTPTNETLTLHSPLLGKHNLQNVALAVSVAKEFKLVNNEIINALKNFKPAFGRADLQSIGNSLILCDYYNANPTSMTASLQTLSTLQNPTSKNPLKIAFLGDMLELGENEEYYHRELSKILLSEKFDEIYLKGEKMKWLAEELNRNPNLKVIQSLNDDHELVAQFLKIHPDFIKESLNIIIKGSRGMKMETIYESLKTTSEKKN